MISVGRCDPDPCENISPPTNGRLGSCSDTLSSGASCAFECESGYALSGLTTCVAGTLDSVGVCAPSPCPAGPLCASSASSGEICPSFACAEDDAHIVRAPMCDRGIWSAGECFSCRDVDCGVGASCTFLRPAEGYACACDAPIFSGATTSNGPAQCVADCSAVECGPHASCTTSDDNDGAGGYACACDAPLYVGATIANGGPASCDVNCSAVDCGPFASCVTNAGDAVTDYACVCDEGFRPSADRAGCTRSCTDAIDCRALGMDYKSVPPVTRGSRTGGVDDDNNIVVANYSLADLVSFGDLQFSDDVCGCACWSDRDGACGAIVIDEDEVLFDKHCSDTAVLRVDVRLPFEFDAVVSWSFDVDLADGDSFGASWDATLASWDELDALCARSGYDGYLAFGTDREVLTTRAGVYAGSSDGSVERTDTIRFVVSQRGGLDTKDVRVREARLALLTTRAAIVEADACLDDTCDGDCDVDRCCRPLMGPCDGLDASTCTDVQRVRCAHGCDEDFDVSRWCRGERDAVGTAESAWRAMSEEGRARYAPEAMSPWG